MLHLLKNQQVIVLKLNLLKKKEGEIEDLIPPEEPAPEETPSVPDEEEKSNSVNLTFPYYLALLLFTLIIGVISIYLLMSGFNEKTFKETITGKDSITYIVLAIIFTGGLLVSLILLTNNYLLTGTNKQKVIKTNTDTKYSAKLRINSKRKLVNKTYKSTIKDQNVILIDGDFITTLDKIKINKTGDSEGGDNTSFYGTNSAILAKGGTVVNITNSEIVTEAVGANAIFSYGGTTSTDNEKEDGTTVNISDTKITTSKDNSGGIMTTGGGIMNAVNLTVSTKGISSAAIRSDKGGGKVTVSKGSYKTSGQGSPVIYSTADITVNDAELTSKSSEGVVIEGANSVTLKACTLEDTNNTLNGKSTTYKNIFLYQSMSGDAKEGNAVFTAKDSKIITNKGDTLYVTNTTATINLESNEIINKDKDGNFLRIQKDSWGKEGSNGGKVTLNLKSQKATGKIVVDSISELIMNVTNNSYFEGTINKEKTAKSIKLKLDKTSKIKLTSDIYVTSFDNDDIKNTNIDFNGHKLYINGEAIK